MKNIKIITLLLFLLLVTNNVCNAITDSQIKEILIKESINNYSGNCPCPYNRCSNGSRCGGRSAWSRGGGYSPLCFPDDVTPQMIKQYRQSHKCKV
jgi:hypothetical protein